MKKLMAVILIVAAAAAAAAAAAGPVRLFIARREADQFAKKQNINMKYEQSGDISSHKDFLTEIWQIAVWEEQIRTQVNEAFGYTDKQYKDQKIEAKSGFAPKEELDAFAMEEKWRELRALLKENVYKAIDTVFDGSDHKSGLDKQDVRSCYREGYFGNIISVMQAVDEGAGMTAYSRACYRKDGGGRELPMDIAYGLRPKLIRAGCEADLQNAVKSNELYMVRDAVRNAEKFQTRYKVTVDGLENAKKKEERLEYASRPEVPAVGMSTSAARSTKLGAPTRTTTDTGMWSHKKHTYGDMYWDRNGKQIFKAQYFDGEITAVYDTRNAAGVSPWTSSHNSSSSSSSFDPDDHDIEAYYADNSDEYDDYDDAYEGFLDDEGAWDDY